MTTPKRAFAACLCLCLAAWPSRLPGQGARVSAVIGMNRGLDGSAQGMLGVEARVAAGPRAWRVRPTAGVAAFANIYASQRELQLGAETSYALGSRVGLDLGAGYSHLSLDGAAASGRSSAVYLRASGMLADFGTSSVGLDLRILAGPDRRREDGLYDKVGFVQTGVVFMLGRR